MRIRRTGLSILLTLAMLATSMLTSGVMAQDDAPSPPPDPTEEPTTEPTEAAEEETIEPQVVKAWTFLVYIAADNNLESAGINDFIEMAKVGSTAQMNIVVQFDRAPGYDTRYGDWKDTRRFYITKNMEPKAANGTSLGEKNMGSATTLKDFVTWAKNKYPANKYALVLWNHGGGFYPQSEELTSMGVAWDDTNGNDYLTNKEVSTVLSQVTNNGAKKLELIGFDACLMAQMEVLQHVKAYAKYGVGSEASEPNNGWPYTTILTALKANTGWSGKSLANTIVNKYYASYGNNQTQSAFQFGTPYATLISKLNTFATKMIDKMDDAPSYKTTIKNALAASQKFDNGGMPDHFIDLSDFALQIANLTPDTEPVDAAAKAVRTAVSNVVTNSKAGATWPRAKGITIFFPDTEPIWGATAASYQSNQWLARDTKWNEFLNEYYGTYITVTLTWGSTVQDLDSHLWLPKATPYHVKWTAKGTLTAFPFAMLDVDDTSYLEPENISISKTKPGTYQYNVYKWTPTETPTLKQSGAKIQVYKNSKLIKTLYVTSAGGTSTGRWWKVFKYNTNTKTFTWTNSLSTTPDAAYDNYPSAVGFEEKP